MAPAATYVCITPVVAFKCFLGSAAIRALARVFLLKYAPGMKPDILYHYCPSDSFVSIIASRNLRLSTLALSSDSMEGRHSFRVLHELLLEKESMKLSDRLSLMSVLPSVEETQMVYGLGFCLSLEGDLLSQWRGYAQDGSGVAIGFRRAYLEELVEVNREDLPLLSLRKIQYGDQALRDELVSRTEDIMKLIKQGALDTRVATDGTGESKEDNEDNAAKRSARSQLFEKLVLVKLDAFKFKSVAFQEEREYRLLATSQTNDTPVRREHLQYRAANERILAYATLAMVETGASQISEIVLGPKHATPCEVIEEFLELNGFLNVAVRRSSASYR